jgi:hypothetical protein
LSPLKIFSAFSCAPGLILREANMHLVVSQDTNHAYSRINKGFERTSQAFARCGMRMLAASGFAQPISGEAQQSDQTKTDDDERNE